MLRHEPHNTIPAVTTGRLARVDGLFTSESVGDGHPDKICDQLSDAVLDAALTCDPNARVAVEAAIKGNSVWLFGELSGSSLALDYGAIVSDVLTRIGHSDGRWGIDLNGLDLRASISEQAAEIASGVDGNANTGAGDQGMMFGFATNETPERLPLPIALAHRLVRRQREVRQRLDWLGPDAKAQVSVHYVKGVPQGIHTVVLSSQHAPDVALTDVRDALREEVVRPMLGDLANSVRLLLNPAGSFTEGGPVADAGLTGRKIIADSYGGFARHGGGAFSGKDGTKVDRSAAYAARQLAVALVEAGLAPSAEIRLAYAIGVAEPVAVHIDLGGGNALTISNAQAAALTAQLTPRAIIDRLGLRQPGFAASASFGHFGRPVFSWERADAALLDTLRSLI